MRTPKHCDKHERHETWCSTCTAWDAEALDDENDELRRRIAELERKNKYLLAENERLRAVLAAENGCDHWMQLNKPEVKNDD